MKSKKSGPDPKLVAVFRASVETGKQIVVNLSEAEKELARVAALISGETLSGWSRRMLLLAAAVTSMERERVHRDGRVRR